MAGRDELQSRLIVYNFYKWAFIQTLFLCSSAIFKSNFGALKIINIEYESVNEKSKFLL